MDSEICILCEHNYAGIKKCEALAERLDENLASLLCRVMADWSDAEHLVMLSEELVKKTLVSVKQGGSPKVARELLVLVYARLRILQGGSTGAVPPAGIEARAPAIVDAEAAIEAEAAKEVAPA